jgi:hypothetical protein
MPTVDKFVTSLDVHCDPPKAGQSITVTPIIDGAPSAPLLIDNTVTGSVSSLPLWRMRGNEMQLMVKLQGTGQDTPVFHGGSLRFSPLDNSYYLLRLDLRDARKDNTGRPTDTTAEIEFLREAADSKRVLTMTSPFESCRVRVSMLQFLAAPPLRGAEVNPQGLALVKLKRLDVS